MFLRFTHHVLEQAAKRGTTPAEMADVLNTGTAEGTRPGYEARAKVYPFARQWRGKHYPQKKVRVIYVVEADETVAITVYVYYGSWNP